MKDCQILDQHTNPDFKISLYYVILTSPGKPQYRIQFLKISFIIEHVFTLKPLKFRFNFHFTLASVEIKIKRNHRPVSSQPSNASFFQPFEPDTQENPCKEKYSFLQVIVATPAHSFWSGIKPCWLRWWLHLTEWKPSDMLADDSLLQQYKRKR